MKKLSLVLIVLMSGCASQYQAASQNYRPRGTDNAVEISGELLQNKALFNADNVVKIKFNGAEQITLKLDNQLFGDGAGQAYDGKPTSASCTGRRVNRYTTDVRCIVFIGNEKTVTLSF